MVPHTGANVTVTGNSSLSWVEQLYLVQPSAATEQDLVSAEKGELPCSGHEGI